MTFRRLGIMILMVGSIVRSVGAQVAPAAGTQEAVTSKQPVFTDQLRKAVAFLRVRFTKEGKLWDISGTGFFVFYPDERLGKDLGFTYFVTNRHMAVPGAEEGQSYPVQQFYVRLNLKKQSQGAGMPESAELPLAPASGAPWILPADPSVDLAAIPVNPQQVSADYMAIPVSLILTQDEIKSQQIAAGDQVLFAGYFYQFPGDRRIQPIVREGILAMMPDESIGTTLQKPGSVYLADIHAFHGNSGSPIFVNVGGIRGNGLAGVSYKLLGVISGYYPESETSFSVPAARVLTGEVYDNRGIAAVVPGDEVRALLDVPELKQLRDAGVASFLKNK
jgi:hypothetical protein